MPTSRLRRAATIVEIVVGLSIVGLLAALLLPAVQAARETARRLQCTSNQRQIGIAMFNYESAYRHLPPGSIFYRGDYIVQGRFAGSRNNRGSLLVFILPFMSQADVYHQFDFGMPLDEARFDSGERRGMYLKGWRFSSYICPSDLNPPLSPGLNQVQPSNYYTSMGPTDSLLNNPICFCNSLGNFSRYSQKNTTPESPAGMFSRRGWDYAARLSDCLDGLSNTILMGEVRADSSRHVLAGWSYSNKWGAFTQIPINFDSSSPDPMHARARRKNGCNANCNWNTEVGFKSRHSGGAYFTFGDGSVKFLSESINMITYQNLGSKADSNSLLESF